MSKRESAQAIPDLEKILLLSNLFCVTTDYPLKDEIEDEPFADERDSSIKRIPLAQADDYLKWRASASIRLAAATFLCIIAVIPLLLLEAATTLLVSLFVFSRPSLCSSKTEVAWNRGRIDAISTIFGARVYLGTEKPTNSKFIAPVADKPILEHL